MEKKVVWVSMAVGFLGILSAALGFAAEATRVKASEVKTSIPGECIYPKTPALVLGLSSAVALMIAQAMVSTIAGCLCCKKQRYSSETNWSIALIAFIVSWVTFIIAFLLLLTGAALNDQRGQESMYFGSYCYVVKPGVFAGGAVLALASVTLGIVYYVALSNFKSTQTWGPQSNQGIAMARPEIPPQSSQPVFVHEDTYNRRQVP
ncbi:putative modifying wall lignin-1/2 [Dioscorea sansibarensis]